jgi:DNA-binding winged helix-turn-helix (wHTH) protein
MSYRFGNFRLEAAERRLLCDGTVVPLTPKVFDTLVLLLENAGHLVSKEELLGKIWPGMVVEEANLTKNMWAIRKALAAVSEGPTYIETVPKVGYRWIGPAERVEPATDAEPSGHARQAPLHCRRRRRPKTRARSRPLLTTLRRNRPVLAEPMRADGPSSAPQPPRHSLPGSSSCAGWPRGKERLVRRPPDVPLRSWDSATSPRAPVPPGSPLRRPR